MLEENKKIGRIEQELQPFSNLIEYHRTYIGEKPQKCNEFGKVFNPNSYHSQYWVIYTG